MIVSDLSPRMIGKRVRIHDDDLDITGYLTDLTVTTEPVIGEVAVLSGVVVSIGDHELRLTGYEDCTITGR